PYCRRRQIAAAAAGLSALRGAGGGRQGGLVPLHSDYDSFGVSGYARAILARALSVVNIHLMRVPAAFRCRSQAAISRRSHFGSSILRSRHWPRKTPISISTMLSQLACLGVKWNSIRRKIRLASVGGNA